MPMDTGNRQDSSTSLQQEDNRVAAARERAQRMAERTAAAERAAAERALAEKEREVSSQFQAHLDVMDS